MYIKYDNIKDKFAFQVKDQGHICIWRGAFINISDCLVFQNIQY